MSIEVVYTGYGPTYRTIYTILYGECATETNLPQQYRDKTSPETTPFAFRKRLPYVTATATVPFAFSRRLRDVTTGYGLTNENTARLLQHVDQ